MMTIYTDKDYEELAQAVEAGELAPVSGTLLTGEDAQRSALAMLKAATGTDDYDELVKMTRGRRKLSDQNFKNSHSPVLNVRITEELNATIRDLASKRGQNTSEVVRDLLVKGLATIV